MAPAMTPPATNDTAPARIPRPRGAGIFGTIVRCAGGPAAIFFGVLGLLAFGGNAGLFLLSLALVLVGMACLLDYGLRVRAINSDSA